MDRQVRVGCVLGFFVLCERGSPTLHFGFWSCWRSRATRALWCSLGRMADVDSLLSELDGLLKDSPPGKRASAPQRPSAAPAAPRLAPGRPAVEDDIDSLLSSLGGAEAFSSNAASKTTCAPRAACPPSAVPSSSSAPPDGTSCATKYVPAARLPAPPLCPSTPHPRPCPASSVAACGAASATSR